jgi:hypothetical protein
MGAYTELIRKQRRAEVGPCSHPHNDPDLWTCLTQPVRQINLSDKPSSLTRRDRGNLSGRIAVL